MRRTIADEPQTIRPLNFICIFVTLLVTYTSNFRHLACLQAKKITYAYVGKVYIFRTIFRYFPIRYHENGSDRIESSWSLLSNGTNHLKKFLPKPEIWFFEHYLAIFFRIHPVADLPEALWHHSDVTEQNKYHIRKLLGKNFNLSTHTPTLWRKKFDDLLWPRGF